MKYDIGTIIKKSSDVFICVSYRYCDWLQQFYYVSDLQTRGLSGTNEFPVPHTDKNSTCLSTIFVGEI